MLVKDRRHLQPIGDRRWDGSRRNPDWGRRNDGRGINRKAVAFKPRENHVDATRVPEGHVVGLDEGRDGGLAEVVVNVGSRLCITQRVELHVSPQGRRDIGVEPNHLGQTCEGQRASGGGVTKDMARGEK